MDQVIGLFPTPLLRHPALLDTALVAGLAGHFAQPAKRGGAGTGSAAQTTRLKPGDHPLIGEVVRLLTPRASELGSLLFGEPLPWMVKELWVSVLEAGGRQPMQNHANSFVSGIVHLTGAHPSTRPVFMKAPAHGEFAFRNANPRASVGTFNAERWVSPELAPGDALIFPSWLLHELPPNEGPQCISIGFNAIPQRLNSWDYAVSLAP
jgi:hypothetical protein